MLRRIVFGLILSTVCCAQTAEAAQAGVGGGCKLQIVANPSQWRMNGVDVFANDPTFASFDLQLINSGTADCTGRIALDTQGTPFGLSANGGRRIFYSIIDHATGADLTPRNGRSLPRLGRVLVISAGGETLARYDVVVSSAFPTDGIYSQQLFVEMADPNDGNVVAQHPVTLAANVPSSATIALSGNFTRVGGAADVDLGELSQGMVKVPLIVHIKSTRAYKITSSSENGGKLVLAGTGWSIPYKLSFAGNGVDPAGAPLSPRPATTRASTIFSSVLSSSAARTSKPAATPMWLLSKSR